MAKYEIATGSVRNTHTATKRDRDLTRAHALNWGVGAGLGLFCCVVIILAVMKALGFSAPRAVLWLIPVAPASGLFVFALKLIRFTEEYRDLLYATEDLMDIHLDSDGEVGTPKTTRPQGAVLRGIDGQPDRYAVMLSQLEIRNIRAYLLQNEKASVRGLTGLVGDRASLLRDELIRHGICEAPRHERAAARLSKAGRIAVDVW